VIRISVRRVWLALSDAFPFRAFFIRAWQNLRDLGMSQPPTAGDPTGPAPCPAGP